VIAAAGVEVPPLAAEESAGVGPLEKRPQPAVSMAAPASMPMNLAVEVGDRVMVGEL
jgi:hypothetical protein